jgi:hypothetical protein
VVGEEEVEDVVNEDVDGLVELVELVDREVHTGWAQLSFVDDVDCEMVVELSETGLPGDENT